MVFGKVLMLSISASLSARLKPPYRFGWAFGMGGGGRALPRAIPHPVTRQEPCVEDGPPGSCADGEGLRVDLGRLLGLVKLYVVGGGNYARFWKYISLVFIGGLVIFGAEGGLTRFLVESRDARYTGGLSG
jgi:hypothetical protein